MCKFVYGFLVGIGIIMLIFVCLSNQLGFIKILYGSLITAHTTLFLVYINFEYDDYKHLKSSIEIMRYQCSFIERKIREQDEIKEKENGNK